MSLFSDKRKKYVLDTSIIIDGRLMVLYRNDLIDGRIILPSFVLRELQQMADSSIYVTSKKAKRGFSSLNDLKSALGRDKKEVEMPGNEVPEQREVDDKLVAYCKAEGAILVTTDGNLTHVARLKDVKVLNPNVLMNQLRRVAMPGEKYAIRLTEPGKQEGQAIGYLPDGLLVVVDNGAKYLGQVVSVVVRNVLVGEMGPIIFAEILWERGR